MPVATFAIGDAVLRFMIDEIDNADEYLSIGLFITCISCLIVAILLPLTDLPVFGGLGKWKFYWLLAYISNTFFQYFGKVARGFNDIRLSTISAIVASLSTAITCYVCIAVLRLGLAGYFCSYILGGIIGSFVIILSGNYIQHIHLLSRSVIHLRLKQMLPYALPLVPNNVFWLVNNTVSRFIITSFLGVAASGIYAAVIKIPNLLIILYNIFFQAWTLSTFQEFKSKDVSSFYSTVFKFVFSFISISASGIILFSQTLASIFLKKSFFDSWQLMPLLIFGLYFNALGSFWGSIYTMTMKTRQILSTTVIGVFVCVVLSCFFIPFFSLYGACFAMIVSNFVIFIVRLIGSRNFFSFHYNVTLMVFSFLVLLIQSIYISFSLPYYSIISFICLFVLFVVHFFEIKDDLVKIFSLLSPQKP